MDEGPDRTGSKSEGQGEGKEGRCKKEGNGSCERFKQITSWRGKVSPGRGGNKKTACRPLLRYMLIRLRLGGVHCLKKTAGNGK